ncbi:MAG: hypothetical protein HZB67_00330 [Candidatus Aenigmarchaeota archaeon]|nr:hypothetical protein [Candidatus Aenigmarchaeota archaeon]
MQYNRNRVNNSRNYRSGSGLEGIVCLAIAVAGLIAWDSRNAPEKYVGFPEIDSGRYVADSFFIPNGDDPKKPNRGDVILIEKVPGEKYRVILEPDGDKVIEGPLHYKLRPKRGVTRPQMPCDTDMRGNTPDNCNYWEATRNGWVRLAPKK